MRAWPGLGWAWPLGEGEAEDEGARAGPHGRDAVPAPVAR